MKTSYSIIKGFEIMRMFKKGQFNIWMYGNRSKVSFLTSNLVFTAELRPKFIVLYVLYYWNGAQHTISFHLFHFPCKLLIHKICGKACEFRKDKEEKRLSTYKKKLVSKNYSGKLNISIISY